mmetsp:Transcript_7766/g.14522  ORF Transcript_7766/g.14522 Transcript_7766/m.14522 type:complete len:212 (-) Transcript_7766:632-1267(-)
MSFISCLWQAVGDDRGCAPWPRANEQDDVVAAATPSGGCTAATRSPPLSEGPCTSATDAEVALLPRFAAGVGTVVAEAVADAGAGVGAGMLRPLDCRRAEVDEALLGHGREPAAAGPAVAGESLALFVRKTFNISSITCFISLSLSELSAACSNFNNSGITISRRMYRVAMASAPAAINLGGASSGARPMNESCVKRSATRSSSGRRAWAS